MSIRRPFCHILEMTQNANTLQHQAAAALGSRRQQLTGHGQKLTQKQEAVIAVLLTERTCEAAAAKAGVGERTIYRWLPLPDFCIAFEKAKQESVKSAICHVQVGTRPASESC